MIDERPFDTSLLLSSIDERIAWFKNHVIKHEIYNSVRAELLGAIIASSGADIIMVVGPTGVGKTTLLKSVIKELIGLELSEMERNLGYVPIAAISAVTPAVGNFNWKDYFIRCLSFYDEPLIEYKHMFHSLRKHCTSTTSAISSKETAALQRALEGCIKNHQTKYFFIDEASALLNVSGGRKLLDQMDVIKTFCNTTGIKHVLLGTYQLLACIGLSAQLNRRIKIIHFPRYKCELKKDSEKFGDVLYSLQHYLPIEVQPNLFSRLDYFQQKSVGCIGILKDWLNLSLEVSLRSGNKDLPFDIIGRMSLTNYQLLEIVDEIREGEGQLVGPSDEIIEEILYGDIESTAQIKDTKTLASERRGRKRPGERNPKRDLTGVRIDEAR